MKLTIKHSKGNSISTRARVLFYIYLMRVTHNSNSTDELVALDPKSTIIRVKMCVK